MQAAEMHKSQMILFICLAEPPLDSSLSINEATFDAERHGNKRMKEQPKANSHMKSEEIAQGKKRFCTN